MSTLVLPKTVGRFEDAWISCKSDFWQIVTSDKRSFFDGDEFLVVKSPNLSGNWSEFSWSIIQFLKIVLKKTADFLVFFVTQKGRWWSQLEVTSNLWRGHIPISQIGDVVESPGFMNHEYLDLRPSKECQMVPKGCQFTIPSGLIGTPWKVLVLIFIIAQSSDELPSLAIKNYHPLPWHLIYCNRRIMTFDICCSLQLWTLSSHVPLLRHGWWFQAITCFFTPQLKLQGTYTYNI